MSGFDKEAERERLREKYERDERKRANTRRMSELLLKGATMTNRHCDTCGDPIFRYDGQEFCATCQAEGTADAAAADADGTANAGADDEAAGDATAAGAEAVDEAPARAGEVAGDTDGDVEADADGNAAAAGTAAPASRAEGSDDVPDDVGTPEATPDPAGRAGGERASASPSSTAPPADPADGRTIVAEGPPPATSTTPAPEPKPEGAASDGETDLRASLRRVVERQVGAAEATDDPRRAREHLAAAREAAETLAALRR